MTSDYQIFVKKMKEFTDIDLSLYKETQMKRRLQSLYEKLGFSSFIELYKMMEKDEQILFAVLDKMTINVSQFYRNRKRWEVLEKKIFPMLLNKNPTKPLKIWSAACSSGEEPYTIAMVLSNHVPLANISILATDIDRNILQKAKLGIYNERAIQEVPHEILERYFTRDGSIYKVKDSIKKTVHFKQHNLLTDPFDRNFDLIVCRNVMIYFTEEAKDLLYRKFNYSLKMEGILFVGGTEQIFSPEKYGFQSEDTFFYKKIADVWTT